MRLISVVVCLLCGLPIPELTAQPQPVTVDLKSAGDAILKGSYFSPGKSGPGIILFHQCSNRASRHLWDALAGDLVNVGFHVLTFDNRGFGETKAPLPPPPPPSKEPIEGDRWGVSPFPVADGTAALTYLTGQNGVDASRIAVGGSSCGADQASNVAAESPAVRALVILSGLPTARGIAHIRSTPSLAVLTAYAEQDMAGTPINRIVPASRNPQSMVRTYPGAEHGVALLTAQPELRATIVKWLVAQTK